MRVAVSQVRTLDGVPRTCDSVIVQMTASSDGPVVRIRYRCAAGRDEPVDQVVHRKCPANQNAALRLAGDLALLSECGRVYVLDEVAETSLPPGAVR